MKSLDIQREFNRLVDITIDYFKTGYYESEKTGQKIEEHAQQEKTPPIKDARVNSLSEEIRRCTRCSLHVRRKNAVPGKGSANADIMFIGEGPGELEDIKGEPFVGKAGQLLTRMLTAISLTREEVYITNIVKCRPPNNRAPLPEEVDACFPYLERQIELISPLILCCLGGPAANALLASDLGISKLRGTIHQYRDYPVIPTYHPAAVLRFPEKYKRHVWNDLKMLRDYYHDLRK